MQACKKYADFYIFTISNAIAQNALRKPGKGYININVSANPCWFVINNKNNRDSWKQQWLVIAIAAVEQSAIHSRQYQADCDLNAQFLPGELGKAQQDEAIWG